MLPSREIETGTALARDVRISSNGQSFTLDFGREALIADNGQNIHLEPQQWKLLSYFVRHPKQVVTHSEIRNILWPGHVFGGDAARSISILRKCLGDDAAKQEFIQTKHGSGYSFCATVEELTKDDLEEHEVDVAASWERRWDFLQSKEFTSLEIFIHFKHEIGFDRAVQHLGATRISFGREGGSFPLSQIISMAGKPNSNREIVKSDGSKPIVNYWRKYEPVPHISYCEVGLGCGVSDTVMGFEAEIPWETFCQDMGSCLADLGRADEIGFSFPPEILQLGLNDFQITFNGKEFSFCILPFSDDGLLAAIEQMATTFSAGGGGTSKMPIGTSLGGFQLWQMFFEQGKPDSKKTPSKSRMGVSGKEKSISFYPEFPKSFWETERAEDYTFTITVPPKVDWEKEISELKLRLQSSPSDLELRHGLASAYYESGNTYLAASYLDECIQEERVDAKIYLLAAYIANKDFGLASKGLDLAKKALDSAIGTSIEI